ncbi:FxLYD domain-containing protein [Garciella nitratireducens]|uniref:Lipoprotein n=1 Tax=Garciella nitratireducens DSM 15102 TaxID=1121911 RepID=A0A1T4N489_9FIRM|nr:FxLYD domain-containing protein [Garciella nitratireducens]SJZ74149.1 hypothetical protein SAMN02745973_01556 [Garciella nitratireducens DSM 15102]
MKKIGILLFVLMLSFVMVACSGQTGSTTSEEGPTEKEQVSEETSTSNKAEPKAEVTQTAFQAWKGYEITNAHGAIEITNTGQVPIYIGDISIGFVGKDNSIISTATMLLPVPEILQPGEKAYAGETVYIDTGEKPEDITNIEVNIDFDSTEETAQTLTVKDLKVAKDSDYTKVTGRIENTSDVNADDVRYSIALMDKDDTLLGVFTSSLDVTLGSGKTATFEASYPELPASIAAKVDHVEGYSYNCSLRL